MSPVWSILIIVFAGLGAIVLASLDERPTDHHQPYQPERDQ